MDENTAVEALSAIANPIRLRILRMLVVVGAEGMPAGDIAQSLSISPSGASFHLNAMSDAGLVHGARQSRQIRYHIDFDAVGGLMRYLLEDCCQNEKSIVSCCLPKCKC